MDHDSWIDLQWDKAKSVQAIGWLARALEAKYHPYIEVDKLQVILLLYKADRIHLSRYGRSITKDYRYIATIEGIFPRRVYGLVGEAWQPAAITRIEVPTDVALQEFSETDIECLEEAFDSYAKYIQVPGATRRLARDDTWRRVTRSGAHLTKSSVFFNVSLEEIVADLPNASAVRRLLVQEGYIFEPQCAD